MYCKWHAFRGILPCYGDLYSFATGACRMRLRMCEKVSVNVPDRVRSSLRTCSHSLANALDNISYPIFLINMPLSSLLSRFWVIDRSSQSHLCSDPVLPSDSHSLHSRLLPTAASDFCTVPVSNPCECEQVLSVRDSSVGERGSSW